MLWAQIFEPWISMVRTQNFRTLDIYASDAKFLNHRYLCFELTDGWSEDVSGEEDHRVEVLERLDGRAEPGAKVIILLLFWPIWGGPQKRKKIFGQYFLAKNFGLN
jgi:hypothetical protein